MANHVDGKVIIITGAAGGFGRLVAQKTGALGARVVASDVNETELQVTVDCRIKGQEHIVDNRLIGNHCFSECGW